MNFRWLSRLGLASLIVVSMTVVASGEKIAEAAAESTSQQLPEAVASFGAATLDGWIYVYGGHTGTAHDHSKDNLSQSFRRRRVQGGDWEELPMQTPLQGLALVPHQGAIYRIGGMTAKNAADEDADLHSSQAFAKFDPATKKWTQLSPLPVGRSSHDAVVIDGRIYIVGGWNLNGGEEGDWQTDALVFDLNDTGNGWTTIDQPFLRRALAATQFGNKLYVIGGMNDSHEIDRSVDVFDPANGTWSEGPEFPGEGMNGFGVSAWNKDGAVFASGSDGVLYRLSDDGAKWDETTQLDQPRFFHQIVPGHNGDLLVLGGASRRGHLHAIERILIDN